MITSHLEVGFKIAGSAGVYVSPYKAIGFGAGQEAGHLPTRGSHQGQETEQHPLFPKDTTIFKHLHTWLHGLY